MLSITHLEVGTLATFLRLALPRKQAWPIPLEQFRNGALGQNWIHSSRQWASSTRVIDVGCGYSDLPLNLAATGCEVWGADDFGLKSGDVYWLRGKHPEEFVRQHSQVRYVFERLGEDQSSFKEDYFDVVISNQALHVAKPPHAPIWRDMLRVLRKSSGSEILVSMICNFGSDGNPAHSIQRMKDIQKMEEGVLGTLAAGNKVTVDEFETLQLQTGQSFHRFSPALYVAYVAAVLDVKPFAIPAELLAENFCTRVNSLIDPVSVGFNNARFSNSPDEARKFRYGRYSPVLMRLSWDDEKSKTADKSPRLDFGSWKVRSATLANPADHGRYLISPLGGSKAVKLVEDNSNSTHTLAREMPFAADGDVNFTILARPAGRNYIGLWLRGPDGTPDLLEAFFDLSRGVVTSQTRHGSAVLQGANIVPVGGGWMRCTLRGRPSNAKEFARCSILLRMNIDGSSQYQGNGRSGVELGFSPSAI